MTARGRDGELHEMLRLFGRHVGFDGEPGLHHAALLGAHVVVGEGDSPQQVREGREESRAIWRDAGEHRGNLRHGLGLMSGAIVGSEAEAAEQSGHHPRLGPRPPPIAQLMRLTTNAPSIALPKLATSKPGTIAAASQNAAPLTTK